MKNLEIKSPNQSRNSIIYLKVVIFALVMSMIGCDQEDEIISVVDDDTNEILLAGSDKKIWLIISSKINGVEWLPECMEDDDWEFSRNNQFSRSSTSLSCSNGIPDSNSSTWSFSNNQTWLTFGGGTYEITSLTESMMILTFPKSNGDTFVDTWVEK